MGRLETHSENETRALAARLAGLLRPGDVLALVGDLGAGKTRFVQGLARGLGVPEDVPVTSPTFTLLATFRQGRLPLFHFDLYRLANEDDLARIGAEEYLWGEGVAAVEWAERAPKMMPDETLWIHFSFAGEVRELAFRSIVDRWRTVVKDLGGPV
ncbi:MAG: tRNA (adenosine(37)-N6)-threonylcarbamoyltransferase complex ATPase subunit type 1 TsaE [Myxococcales bacterium]|nr:tRNA (adenosine(37)-N6)-threonylcarbamoyltransferase complex ATPase subunit type 1 TsaE [Myxococcales bacterium]